MTIRHHLSDPLLIAYAAGTLPEAFDLVVATHLSLCDDCRARAAAFDAVGGAVMEEAGEVDLAEDGLAAVLARIEAEGAEPPARLRIDTRRMRSPCGLPAPLTNYIGGSLAGVKWRPLGLGVRQAILPTSEGATARLLYIPAGHAVPDHGHRGTELTLVLQGAFRDASDRFGPGDVEIADQDVDHIPVAEAGVDCICLAATDAPLRFRSLMPRLAQPFFRI